MILFPTILLFHSTCLRLKSPQEAADFTARPFENSIFEYGLIQIFTFFSS
jgi:hypothetical protein